MIDAELVPYDEIDGKIRHALDAFRENDFQLLKTDAHEIAITHQIACYLKIYFSEWHVDCEYNRRGMESKTDLNGANMRPDIIIHERYDEDNPSKRNNLLVIEIKKNYNDDDNDRRKLKELTNKNGKDHYQFGVFLCISEKRPYDAKWDLYQNDEYVKTITG
jgi:hypothetical protein